MTVTPLLSIQELSRSYGRRRGIEQVSLDLGRGEIVGLLGPNGSGKTTLLECVLGLRQPDSGAIRWGPGMDGQELRRCGAQLQGETLPPRLTVREVLDLHAAYWPEYHPLEELVEQAQLGDLLAARTETLSAGQRQRVALALAFQPRVPLIVLDEPSTGLDQPARDALHAWIRRRALGGVGFFIASHDPWEAATLFQRVIYLRNGCIQESDTDGLSGATALLRLHTEPPLTELVVRAWPGVRTVSPEGSGWALRTEAPLATLRSMIETLSSTGTRCVSLAWTAETGREGAKP